MAQQVSGSNKTLKDAIRDGDVQVPVLMRWNTWQQWRRDTGLRPTAAVDGEATTTGLESVLWKSTMLDLYGEDWTFELLGKDEAQAPALVAQGRAPCLRPDASADEPSLNTSLAVVESRAEVSPGRGQGPGHWRRGLDA